MVRAGVKEMYGCASTEMERLVMNNFRRGRGRLKKYLGEVIR